MTVRADLSTFRVDVYPDVFVFHSANISSKRRAICQLYMVKLRHDTCYANTTLLFFPSLSCPLRTTTPVLRLFRVDGNTKGISPEFCIVLLSYQRGIGYETRRVYLIKNRLRADNGNLFVREHGYRAPIPRNFPRNVRVRPRLFPNSGRIRKLQVSRNNAKRSARIFFSEINRIVRSRCRLTNFLRRVEARSPNAEEIREAPTKKSTITVVVTVVDISRQVSG